uniref:Putative beta-glucosides PTS, EIIB n=1 Tax=uncultured bacterium contig00006 TaxID=1181498 RepID=A0A806JYI3_9BACT|nr:putative beta-glucosides PTS, EIIB [uncultured bacterium contig00006]
MKLLLICAGGASTSILMKKLEKHAAEKGMEFSVEAHSVGEYEDVADAFDVIMLGPQVSYKKNEVAEHTGKPVGVVAPMDYALGQAANIFKQIEGITAQG